MVEIGEINAYFTFDCDDRHLDTYYTMLIYHSQFRTFNSNLPISPVHFVDYSQLELPCLIGGKSTGQKLTPPFQQFPHYFAQCVEFVGLPFLIQF